VRVQDARSRFMREEQVHLLRTHVLNRPHTVQNRCPCHGVGGCRGVEENLALVLQESGVCVCVYMSQRADALLQLRGTSVPPKDKTIKDMPLK